MEAVEGRVQMNAHGCEVAHDLRHALVITHVQRAFAASAGRLQELACKGGFGRARQTRDQRAAAAVHAASEQCVEIVEAEADALRRSAVSNGARIDDEYLDTGRSEGHRELGCREARAAVLHHLNEL